MFYRVLDKASTIFGTNRLEYCLVLRVFISIYHTIANRKNDEVCRALHHQRTGSMFCHKRRAKPNLSAFYLVGLLRGLQTLCASGLYGKQMLCYQSLCFLSR